MIIDHFETNDENMVFNVNAALHSMDIVVIAKYVTLQLCNLLTHVRDHPTSPNSTLFLMFFVVFCAE